MLLTAQMQWHGGGAAITAVGVAAVLRNLNTRKLTTERKGELKNSIPANINRYTWHHNFGDGVQDRTPDWVPRLYCNASVRLPVFPSLY